VENTDVEPRLSDVLLAEVELPSKILTKPFGKYLFFDTDISTSQDLISAIRSVVTTSFGNDVEASVFASANRIFLGYLKKEMNWPNELFRLTEIKNETVDAGGLAIMDMSRRWIAYQSRPVDLGIFALECSIELGDLQSIKDNFFDCISISSWLMQRTSRDADLVRGFGANYLATLVKNYS
jgi:hypothetical protein